MHFTRKRILIISVGAGSLVALTGLVLPAIQVAREAAIRAQSTN